MYVEAPPFAEREREPFAREAVHKLERKGKREIIHEKDRRVKGCNHRWRRTLRLCHDTPEEKEDQLRRRIPSEASPWSTVPCLAP
jgi:hypothetical protein